MHGEPTASKLVNSSYMIGFKRFLGGKLPKDRYIPIQEAIPGLKNVVDVLQESAGFG